MRKFNTSGPNIIDKHYTVQRTSLIKKGLELVKDERYFTIWAPRQTGKSTYFLQLAEELKKQNYKVAHINFENYKNAPIKSFVSKLKRKLNEDWNIKINASNIPDIFEKIERINNQNLVLIIDEVEGINAEFFGEFLHSIRSAYHSRSTHGLKSVILVGVSNILGVVSDNASPFNIADNLEITYFNETEIYDLLSQHEVESGQLFDNSVKQKILQMTAGQPGLVNGFARRLVEEFSDKKIIEYDNYLKTEDWYLTEAIDKNFSNILNKANEERNFVERLLFTEEKIPFKVDRPSIKLLHTNGLIKKDIDGNVIFWVPFYKKRLYDAFYPYTNGEQKEISQGIFEEEYFNDAGKLNLNKLIETYKEYIKRRGFNPHREKDKDGKYKSIKEAALIYSFETYIHAFISQVKGKIYREANTGLGKSDMILNINNNEYLIETKIYYAPKQFKEGKNQLAYYAKSLNILHAIYIVFCPNNIKYPETVNEKDAVIDNILITTFLIEYDEKKWK